MKRFLLKQFSKCYDENGWFVAVRNAIDGVTADEAAWKPDGADHSICEIVNHLNFYNYAYLERFKGVDHQYPVDDNDATFAAAQTIDEETWAAATTRFDWVLSEFRVAIEAADESKFDEPVSTEDPSKWKALISNMNTHNAYHAGQILLLRKLQGSWDAANGVS